MPIPLNIVIIGTGNVATHIAQSFQENKTVNLLQAFNHRLSKLTKVFASQFTCEVVTDYKKINTTADIYIIAVKDDAILEVAKNLSLLKLKGIVVHTSGSVDMTVLKNASTQIGVYYPLQTFFSGAIINWKAAPLLVEANTPSAYKKLHILAASVSDIVKKVDSKKRLQLHLAAVFACNFTNAMYVTAYQLIETHLSKKDTVLLFPLMQQSFDKLKTTHPITAQTGPAKRNDKQVMKKHLELLMPNKELIKVYELLSNLIVAQQSTTKK